MVLKMTQTKTDLTDSTCLHCCKVRIDAVVLVAEKGMRRSTGKKEWLFVGVTAISHILKTTNCFKTDYR